MLPLELSDTAATHGANCEAISISIEFFKFNGRVFIEPRVYSIINAFMC